MNPSEVEVLCSNYPQGNEDEESQKLLFKFFCNNIYLGQWELAAACIHQLTDKTHYEQIRNVLKDVIQYPYKRSLWSSSVASPHHLSWLCLQEYRSLVTCDVYPQQDIEIFQKAVEFSLLLSEIGSQVSSTILKELYLRFQTVTDATSKQYSLSPETLRLLQEILGTSPTVAHAIINSLICRNGYVHRSHNAQLEALYLNNIHELLNKLDAIDCDNDQNKLQDLLYTLLSLFDPEESLNDNDVKSLLQRLVAKCNSSNPVVEKNKILSVLIGRQTDFLVREFLSLDEQYFIESLTCAEHGEGKQSDHCEVCLSSCPERCRVWRTYLLGALQNNQHFLHHIVIQALSLIKQRCFEVVRSLLAPTELHPLKVLILLLAWPDCTDCSDAHALLAVLWDTQIASKSGMLEQECHKLAHQINIIQWCLNTTRPLLLAPSSAVSQKCATELFHTLESHSVLYVLHHTTRLAALPSSDILDIMQKMPIPDDAESSKQKKVVRFADGSDAESPSAPEPINLEQERDISIYRSYCVLRSVMSTILCCLEANGHSLMNPLKSVWRHKRESGSASSVTSRQSSIASCVSRDRQTVGQRKRCRASSSGSFILRQSSICKSKDRHSSGQMSFTRSTNVLRRQTSVNRSESFNDQSLALQFGSYAERHISVVRTHSFRETDKVVIQSKKSDIECSNVEDFQNMYKLKVTERLDSARKHLSRIFPLTYRVEVLENIFSLLFVTHKDIAEEVDQSESGSDSDCEERRKNNFISELSTDLGISGMVDEFVETPPLTPKKDGYSSLPMDTSLIKNNVDYDEPFVDRATRQSSIFGFHRLKRQSSNVTQQHSDNNKSRRQDTLDQSKAANADSGQQISANSTLSTSSLNSLKRLGFITNEYVIRDILSLLRETLLELGTTRVRLSGHEVHQTEKATDNGSLINTDAIIDEQLSDFMLCSISNESFQRRVTRLTKYVSEAQWRYQLVIHQSLPTQPGIVLQEPVYADDNSDSEIMFYSSDLSSKKKKKHANKKGAIIEQGVESEQQTDSASASSRRSRSASYHGSTSIIVDSNRGIVSTMLSSHESLLSLCLKRDQPAQATQVIKLFGLENCLEVDEVNFAQLYTSAVNKLQTYDSKNRDLVQPLGKAGPISIKMLAHVAAAGIATASVSSVTDSLVNAHNLPVMPKPANIENILPGFQDFFQEANLPLIVTLDIACTCSRSWRLCSHLLESAKTCLPKETLGKDRHTNCVSEPGIRRSGDVGKLIGYKQFLQQLDEIVQFVLDNNNPETSPSDQSLIVKYIGPNMDIFLAGSPKPFQKQACKDFLGAVAALAQACEKVAKALTDFKLTRHKESTHISPSNLPGSSKHQTSPMISPKHAEQQPALHSAVKYLIHVLDQFVPSGGFIHHFTMYPPAELAANRNYMLSLYEHVREIAFLVAECESRTKDTKVLPGNYFRMLDDGPITTLGQLMFVRKMPPTRLEKVAEKLSLNLTHIIVGSCCPKVSSHLNVPQLLPDLPIRGFSMDNGVTVLNDSDQWLVSPVEAPELLVRNLLTRTVQLMRDVSFKHNASGVFTLACADIMTLMPDFEDIIVACQELKYIDLELLQSREQKLCFYGNLVNLLTVHCHMYWRWKLLFEKSVESALDESPDQTSPTVLEKIQQYSNIAFWVGQLGIISLFELQYILMRSGLHAPAVWNGIVQARVSALDVTDPWFRYAPLPEPRLLFVIATGCVSSAPIQVLSPELIQSQLHLSMKEYLNSTVNIDMNLIKVTIPELLVWYRRDFVSDHVHHLDAQNEGLINFIASQVTGPVEGQLIDLLKLDELHEYGESIDTAGRKELPFIIDVQDFNYEFLYAFDYEALRRSVHCSMYSREHSSSLPLLVRTSQDSSLSSFPSISDSVTFRLTPITLEYLKSDSMLAATLVSLICSDELDDIEEHFTDDYFSERNRRRSPSDISLVDIRSYRYSRLMNDYPVLKRHLLNYVVPLAAAEDTDMMKGDVVLKFVTSNISNKVKGCMLSLHSSHDFQTCVNTMLSEMQAAENWRGLLAVLRCMPEVIMEEKPHLQTLHDFVLVCAARSLARRNQEDKKRALDEAIFTYLHQFYDSEIQARTVLSIIRSLPVDLAMELLQMCNYSNTLSQPMNDAVAAKLQEVEIYSQVVLCIKNVRLQLSMNTNSILKPSSMDSSAEKISYLDQFCDWRSLLTSPPSEVVKVLLNGADFETARAWINMHHLASRLGQDVEESYIFHLLKQTPSQTSKAFMVLETLHNTDPELCEKTCQRLLNTISDHAHVLFVTNFMLQFLHTDRIDVEQNALQLRFMAAKALLELPKSVRQECEQLVTSPILIIEQLIMNNKADLAGHVFAQLKMDFLNLNNAMSRFTTEQFDQMVSLYAEKTLELPVIHVMSPGHIVPRGSPLKEHTPSDQDQGMAHSATSRNQFSDSMRLPNRSISIDLAVSPRAKLLSSSAGNAGLAQHARTPPSVTSVPRNNDKFVMPPDPPSRDNWVPDSSVTVCMACQRERFSMFNRRHHCRRCGRVVCASCSAWTTTIKGMSSRTCDQCYELMFQPRVDKTKRGQEVIASTIVSPPVSRERLSGESNHAQQSPGDEERGYGAYTATSAEQTSVIINMEHIWKLSTIDEQNEMIKEDFYFAEAPSASLCISLLTLLHDQHKAGELMLKSCDQLSENLKPLAPGIPNPEVDYNLVISMMKYLLFHAKIKFTEVGDGQGHHLCDTYLSHIDLLSLLIAENVSDLPSIHELTKLDSVRRLRDKLIENERFPLAMEVSTKCGLDPAGVWSIWGMACLQCGQYASAREKFAHCLKAPLDRNQNVTCSKLLHDIVDNLESMPATGTTDVQLLLSSEGSLKSLIAAPPPRYVDETSLDSQQFQECVYYLRTYGCYVTMVDFYRRNGYLMKAVQYILDHKCSTDVFVEALLVPCLTEGQLGILQDQLVLIDPSLDQWGPYLTATCRHLMKNKLIHVLYQIQLFMKDFIRASMTCIQYFYQSGAQNYAHLSSRLGHLQSARKHLECYLDPSQWGSVKPALKSGRQGQMSSERSSKVLVNEPVVRLVHSMDEVNRNLKTIIFQTEITQYLHKSLKKISSDQCSNTTALPSPPPTLFQNARVRADLVSLVLIHGEQLATSFDLALRIVKEYHLSPVPIFTHVAREMAKSHDLIHIHELLDCLRCAGMDDDDTVDDIIGACIIILADQGSENKEVDGLIKILRSDSNKINAMILCGKLKSAYLLAVRADRVDDVHRIAGAAHRAGQAPVKNICDKWLQQRQQRK